MTASEIDATPSDNAHGTDESTDNEPDWESIARSALGELIFTQQYSFQKSLGTIETHLDDPQNEDLTADHINQFRRDFYDLQCLIEEDIVPLVDGVDPYENAMMNLTFGQVADGVPEEWLIPDGYTRDEVEAALEAWDDDE